MQNFLDSAKSAAEREQSNIRAADDKFAAQYPALYAYLTETQLESGKARQTATLVVFTEDGSWKCTLIERQYDLQLWDTSGSFLGLLDALEAKLLSDDPGWRKPTKSRHKRS